MYRSVILLTMMAGALGAQDRASWNAPQEPFKIYGNSYWVGTHGLGSVLITSPQGHVLIDGALPESAQQIAAHVRALGFRVEDIKLILNSHVHYDHAGGIAQLQKLSGARVAASEWTAAVLRSGKVARDDPQYGSIAGIARVARVETSSDKATLTVGPIAVTEHLTPGHTPGGTSWTWQSCEGARCLNLVYADSLTPVSSDGFLFSRGNLASEFDLSDVFLESTPCDILVTPHPDVSNLWERLAKRSTNPDALVDSRACKDLAARAREQLKQRLAKEQGQK
ncbi:MAG TPA: subclass B3 metallo-beta-lactamase [Bryobacteraceae bacterium]|nr:subclass B3 metallo-beta-lactamase [Bryobacteraceae bacterium]